ncbi:hypothetical protein KCU71_g158, partial [Aureobasidium melanogenum]
MLDEAKLLKLEPELLKRPVDVRKVGKLKVIVGVGEIKVRQTDGARALLGSWSQQVLNGKVFKQVRHLVVFICEDEAICTLARHGSTLS